MYGCLAGIYVSVPHAWYLQRPEDNTGSPGTGVPDGFELRSKPGFSVMATIAHSLGSTSPARDSLAVLPPYEEANRAFKDSDVCAK